MKTVNNEKKLTCCLCGKELTKEQCFNPWPLDKSEGAVCCEECHNEKVQRARLNRLTN